MQKVHLTREQRYTISVMHKEGCTQKMIARSIGKDKSVVIVLKRGSISQGSFLTQELQDIFLEYMLV